MDYETLKAEAAKYPDTMTEAERSKAYAEGKEVDRIPFLLQVGEPQANLYGYTMEEYRRSARVQLDVAERSKAEFQVGAPVASTWFGWRGAGQAVGSTVVAPENALEHITDYVLKDYSMLNSLEFDPATNPILQKALQVAFDMQELTHGNCGVATRVSGPMSVAISIRQPDLFLRDMIQDKENAHRLLDFSVDINLKWVKYNLDLFGKISLSISDPGSASNLISLGMFREFSRPHLERMMAGLQALLGTMPGIHICGKTKAIWNDLADIGFPLFSVDNCEDLADLKMAVGDRMVISGNVPPTTVLQNGTIDDVIASVQDCLRKGSDNPKGFLLQPGCQIPAGTPKENLLAYAYAARRYGRGAKKGQLCRGLLEEGLA